MDIQLGRSKTVRRAYGIDEIALVPGGRTVDPEVTDTRWTLGGIEREIPIIERHHPDGPWSSARSRSSPAPWTLLKSRGGHSARTLQDRGR